MAIRRKTARRLSSWKPLRTTRQVLDRDGRQGPLVSMKALRENAGGVMTQARRRGAVAISRNGRPVAVVLAPDQFVSLCVAYTMRAMRSGAPK